MPTKKKVWYEGAVYHITIRGNRRNDIFRDDQDFAFYMTIIENNLVYYSYLNYELIAYCLMDNHVHLMIRTDKQPLARLMRRVHSMYTRYFNKKYNYLGHLFQDKYFSEIIENDTQMLDTSRYIHLNPVKAKMVVCPQEYKWSSYSSFIGLKDEKIINKEMILDYFKFSERYDLYRDFVEKKLKALREELIIDNSYGEKENGINI